MDGYISKINVSNAAILHTHYIPHMYMYFEPCTTRYSGIIYLDNDEEVLPRFSLSDNIVPVLKGAWFQGICHSQPLPLVKRFYGGREGEGDSE